MIRSRMREVFVRELWSDPVKTGAIARSSNELSELITRKARLSDKKVIVEYGPGTGAFTRRILDQVPKDSCFFSIEANEQLADLTRRNNPDALVYHDSAENVMEYLSRHGENSCDCIISSLPWTMFRKELQENILDASVNSLKPGGAFLTYAYIHGTFLPSGKRFRRLLDQKFNHIERSEIVWHNLPPAFVYQCRK